MRSFMISIALVFTLIPASAGERPLSLASLFTDNMVLQQQQEVPIWGTGSPGATVAVRASWGDRAATVVHTNGSWLVHLTTPAAGGPHSVVITCGSEVRLLNNVLTGEVWICSGQSNMEMPLRGWPPRDTITNSAQDIQAADLPQIRLFTVIRATAPGPEESCLGSWSECSPGTVPGFSATAFHFGRELARDPRCSDRPDRDHLGRHTRSGVDRCRIPLASECYDSTLQRLREAERDYPAFKEWISTLPVIDPVVHDGVAIWELKSFHDEALAQRHIKDSAWAVMVLPTIWEKTALGEFDGVVWFRKMITIPVGWLHQDLIMEPGPIDDMDITYVNGTRVGGTEGPELWNQDRPVPDPGGSRGQHGALVCGACYGSCRGKVACMHRKER